MESLKFKQYPALSYHPATYTHLMLIFNDSEFACPTFACRHILKDSLINMHLFHPCACLRLHICTCNQACHALQCTCSLVCDLYVCVCNLDSPAPVEVLFLSWAQESHSFLILHLSFSLTHIDMLWLCLELHTTTQLSKCERHSNCQYMLSCDSRSLTVLNDLKGYY